MHTVSTARQRRVLGALVALALLTAVLFVATEKASATSQCPGGAVCAWSGANYTGNFSWWAANTGCHNHAGNPNIRSMFNNTGHTINIVGRGSLGASFEFGWAEPAITTEICT